LALAILVLSVFGKTWSYRFVNFDDDAYVYANPNINSGISFHGFLWAFSHIHSSNWHPLTSLSHMLDCTLYGLNPAGHHLTNVCLHGLMAILLVLVLFEMTDRLLPSAFVSALFAIHPLRAESVAWVSERKDVLSGLFFVLTLWAYVRYARKPPALKGYAAVLLLFTLGLLCKPILVSFPFVLLLLDYWPLRRWPPASAPDRPKTAQWLLLEKLPLLALAIASCLVTLYAQKSAMDKIPDYSLLSRAENATISYVVYLWQTAVPWHLAALYPLAEERISWWQPAINLVVLGAISWVAFNNRNARPWLIVGWLWYFVTLIPVIGIIAVGVQAHADRYTYLPQIGLWLMVVWTAAELVDRRFISRWVPVSLGGALVVCFSFLAWRQTGFWHDSETLWRHTLASTSKNDRAYGLLGLALETDGRQGDAIAEYQNALRIKPDDASMFNNIGNCLVKEGKLKEAEDSYQHAARAKPELAVVHDNLGVLMSSIGRFQEAAAQFRRATEIQPDFVAAEVHWGKTLLAQRRWSEAMDHFHQAIKIRPELPAPYLYCGVVWAQEQKLDEAVTNYLQALHLNPKFADAHLALATALEAQAKPEEAISHYEEANRLLGYKNLEALLRLDDAYAREKRFIEAIAISQRALDTATALGKNNMADTIRKRIEEYTNEIRTSKEGAPYPSFLNTKTRN
jgi:tetratricopeptide (TPR) repeat protein